MKVRPPKYHKALAVYRETSREAWDSVLSHLSTVDGDIMARIAAGGATCDEIEAMTGYKHQTAAAQIRHMTKAGLLVASEVRRPTRSGRKAIVWVLADPRTIPAQAELG